MTITRVHAETELVSRAKKKMELVGFAVTVAGMNADLNGPLSTALRTLGYTPASPITVADADLVKVTNDQIDEFFDRAELRLLENIQGGIDLVDIRLGPKYEFLGQLATQVEKAIERLRAKISDSYGDSSLSFSVGLVREDGYSEAAKSTSGTA